MNLFDLHCDTIYECYFKGERLRKNNLSLSLCKGRAIKKWCQCFALFIHDKFKGEDATSMYYTLLRTLKSELASNLDLAVLCRTGEQIDEATAEGKCAAILTVENLSMLNGDIDMVYIMWCDGVRMATLTWNSDNCVASGVNGTSGLTAFGKEVVKKFNELGIICDVSHLNEQSFWEVLELSEAPVVASHSNLSSVHKQIRNLTDEQFKAVCQTGGLVGINFYNEFLGGAPLDSIYRHLDRALELGGENNIAIGTDYDGAQVDFPINSVDKIGILCDYLLDRGVSQNVLDKLFYENALRLFRKEELHCITTAQETNQ